MPLLPLKKEFLAYWDVEEVFANTDKMSLWKAKFFDKYKAFGENRCLAVIPDIPFRSLMVFAGKRTRITIEVIE